MLALLAETAIRALLLGAAAWVTLHALGLRNPHVEKLVWRAVLVAALVLPALLYWRLAPVFEVSVPFVVPPEGGAQGAGPPPAVAPRVASLFIALAAIYLGVVSLLVAGFVTGLARMARLSRAADPMPSRAGVRLSAGIRSPATFGSISRRPAAARMWRAAELDAVLAHEGAHVRWRDCHWLWLAQLHLIVFWFSPFSWWLRQRLGALAEATSDDAVLAADHDHIAYAELLLGFARNPNPGRVAMSASGPKVSERIERILSRAPPSAPPRRIARVVAAALLIPATVFAAASLNASASPADYQEVDNNNPAGPRIVDYGDLARLDARYPVQAKQAGVSGRVTLGATIDAEGRVLAVTVLDVQPSDPQYGFGETAMDIARTVRFANPTKAAMNVKFQVKFVLED
jgi:TonB family protein